jgi:serine/threonine protein kinase
VEVVLRLLRGLARLHASGLAHRDIKPSNVVFVARRPKLADIGMITSDTATPSQVGTPAYMPPDRRMDPTADVFAMGRILYELMVGKSGDDFPRLPPATLRGTAKWDITHVQGVLNVACAERAEDRYPHAGRMLEDLESSRELPLDALFGDLAAAEKAPSTQVHPYRPYILAAIHVLPWVLGLVLAIALAQKLL